MTKMSTRQKEQSELELLEADFTIQLAPASIKGAMKEHGASSKDLWMVEPSSLRVIANFNPRVMNESYKAKIREYADSMLANGWFPNSVLNGYTADENGDMVIYVTSGHTRLLALAMANEDGAEILQVPVTVRTKGVSMDDLQVELIQGNEGNALSLYEKAIVCNRLLKSGFTEAEIERRTGVKNPTLGKLFKLMASPHKLKEMVAYETISASFAIEMIEAHGAKALEVIQAAMSTAAENGSTKVTKKFVQGAQFNKYVKKTAPTMYSTLEVIKSDPGYSGLSQDVREKLDALLTEIEQKKADFDQPKN